MNPDIKHVQLQFENFAEQLFSKPPDIKPNSCPVELEILDNSYFTDFLYDVFGYGFRKKIAEEQQKNEPIDETRFFDNLRNYIKAIGFDIILHEVIRGKTGEISDIKISFEPYYEKI